MTSRREFLGGGGDGGRGRGGRHCRRSEAAVRHLALPLHAVHGAAGRHRQLGRGGLGLRRATTGARTSSTRSQDLAPGVIRFGGLFSRYYKWREGVGPAGQAPLDAQLRLGRQGDQPRRARTSSSTSAGAWAPSRSTASTSWATARSATAPRRRATAPATPGRRPTGSPTATIPTTASAGPTAPRSPSTIKLWQLGNETSYGNATFSKDESIAHTIEFAKAMKAARPLHPADRLGRPRAAEAELWARGSGEAGRRAPGLSWPST